MNRYTKWKLYAGGLAIVLDALMYFHFFSDRVPIPPPDAFIIAPVLVLIVELLTEVVSRLDVAESRLNGAVATIGRDSLLLRVANFNEANGRRYLGKYLSKFVHDVTGALDIKEAAYVVTHQQLAIYSYTEFWRMLGAIQRDLHGKKAIEVRAVHCFDPRVFDEKLLEPQKAFIENGGTIERILCGEGPAPTAETRRIADAMTRAGIKVHYHQRNEDAVAFAYTWDYLYIPETKEAVIWASANLKGRIDQAVFSQAGEYFHRDLEDLWKSIYKRSIPIGNSERTDHAASIAAASETT